MITYIEDDVLFTQRHLKELEFIFIYGVLEVYEDSVYVGKLNVHFDEEMMEAIEEEGEEYTLNFVHYVYINNELYHLNKFEVDYQTDLKIKQDENE